MSPILNLIENAHTTMSCVFDSKIGLEEHCTSRRKAYIWKAGKYERNGSKYNYLLSPGSLCFDRFMLMYCQRSMFISSSHICWSVPITLCSFKNDHGRVPIDGFQIEGSMDHEQQQQSIVQRMLVHRAFDRCARPPKLVVAFPSRRIALRAIRRLVFAGDETFAKRALQCW